MNSADMTGSEESAQSQRAPLRVLVIHRYFWPDTPPYALLLRYIAGRWVKDRHNVEVLTSQPSYKSQYEVARRPSRDEIDGVRIIRLNLPNETGRMVIRILNAVRMAFRIIVLAVFRRYDVIMISTVPPVLGGVAAALAARLSRARFIYHCMDIHPEIAVISGEIRNPVIAKMLRSMDSWTCRQADPVIVLSRDMESSLRSRPGVSDLSIQVINNFGLPDIETETENSQVELPTRRFTAIFAGNIGRFQGLETVVDAMARLVDHDDIEFIMMGDGIARPLLEKQALEREANIRFIGHQPVNIAKTVIKKSDVGYISLRAGYYRYAYPSKTMTYLEQGCPVILAVEADSQMAVDAESSGYGIQLPVGDGEALANTLVRLASDPNWRRPMSDNAIRASKNKYSQAVVLDKWSSLLKNERVTRV